MVWRCQGTKMGIGDVAKKVCLLGDFAVGKTSVMERGVRDDWCDTYRTTVGVRVSTKLITWPDYRTLQLILWDMAGGMPDQLRSKHLIGACGLLLIADGTRLESVGDALSLRRQAEQVVGRSLPCALMLNKCDRPSQWQLTASTLKELSSKLPVYIVSAKTGQGIERAFQSMAKGMLV